MAMAWAVASIISGTSGKSLSALFLSYSTCMV